MGMNPSRNRPMSLTLKVTAPNQCQVPTHFEQLRTLKRKSKCVKFGTKSTPFQFFFQTALIWGILTHFEKKFERALTWSQI